MHDSKEKIDYFLERNKAMIKFAQEIQDARRICIESTDRLLKKRALGFDPEDTSSIRSDLKDRLSLMSNRFLLSVLMFNFWERVTLFRDRSTCFCITKFVAYSLIWTLREQVFSNIQVFSTISALY